MITVTPSKFSANQKKYFDLFDQGEKIAIQRD